VKELEFVRKTIGLYINKTMRSRCDLPYIYGFKTANVQPDSKKGYQ